jgi:hypothetical protein
MTKQNQLIALYCTVCHHYNTTLVAEAQRLSNNSSPKFTDEECMTTYIFGIDEGNYDVKAVYRFIKEYYPGWFPQMPSYQNYNRRINLLAESFQKLCSLLVSERVIDPKIRSHVQDSMPIVVASQKRSRSAKSAGEVCDKGYCASKNMYYYGVKLHVFGQLQYKTLPEIKIAQITPASEYDLNAAKEMLFDIHDIDLFADKAFCSKAWKEDLAARGVRLFTPIKLKKGQEKLGAWSKLYSAAVSGARQTIESLFNWIQQKTHIQSASKVRSSNGLFSFVFARLAMLAFFYS